MFKNIFKKHNYYLLREFVRTDFKLRYQGSVLGYLWSLLRPLALFSILYIVFSRFFGLGHGVPHYPAYLLLGIVMWTYFQEASVIGLRAIVDKGDLIRKTNVPKFILVLSTSFSAFVNLMLNFIAVGFFLVLSGADVRWPAIFLPLILIELLVFSGAVSFFLAALFVRFRDITYIWELFMQLFFYATPIIYPLTFVPAHLRGLLMLNPMAQMIQLARYFLVTPETITGKAVLSGFLQLIPYLIVVVTVIIAAVYFKKESRRFAEEI